MDSSDVTFENEQLALYVPPLADAVTQLPPAPHRRLNGPDTPLIEKVAGTTVS